MRVVVVGGGIAGLELVRNIKDLDIEIFLINPSDRMECKALLPEFISYKVSEGDMTVDIRNYCDRVCVEFIKDVALKIEENRVLTRKREIEFDIAVLALGARWNTLGKSYSLQTIEDAVRIRKKLRNAENVVVIGSGPTGIEVACEISEFYCSNVKIIESSDRILPMFRKDVSVFVEKMIRKEGIDVLKSCKVMRVGDVIETDRSLIEFDVAISCTGLKPNPLDGIRSRNGWITVDSFLMVKDRIFAIGDCAHVSIDDRVATKTAVEAERQAKHVAGNIRRILRNRGLKKYRILSSTDKPISFITLARRRAVLTYHDYFIPRPMNLLYFLKKRMISSFLSRFRK